MITTFVLTQNVSWIGREGWTINNSVWLKPNPSHSYPKAFKFFIVLLFYTCDNDSFTFTYNVNASLPAYPATDQILFIAP